MASGTGRDNATTRWSVNAVQKYLGLSLGRAQRAVQTLQTIGVIDRIRDGSRPIYKVRPWPAVNPIVLTEAEKAVLERVRHGEAISANKAPGSPGWYQRQTATRLVKAGLLVEQQPEGVLTMAESVDKPQWIWLPNTLIVGAAGETPPVERLRQTQDVLTLRFLVEAYDAQHLAEHGGINPRYVRQTPDRHDAAGSA